MNKDYYSNKFIKGVEDNIKPYGNKRMDNTNSIRYLIKNNMLSMFNMVHNIVLKNNKNDKLFIGTENNPIVILHIQNGEFSNEVNITDLVNSNNKYGSAIFKRFFKDYDNAVISELIETYKKVTDTTLDSILDKEGNYTNIFGDKLKVILDGDTYKYVIETLDGSNTIVNMLVGKKLAKDFLLFVK